MQISIGLTCSDYVTLKSYDVCLEINNVLAMLHRGHHGTAFKVRFSEEECNELE